MENRKDREMKNIIFLLLAVLMPTLSLAAEEKSTFTYEAEKCSGEEDVFIRGLEEELANCKIQMPDDPSTADMNETYYKVGDCCIAVANKLFDRNYKKYNEQVKQDFDTLVKAFYANAHDMVQHSDFGLLRGGTMYNTEAIATGAFWIRDVVKEYLYQARMECDDKAGFDSLDIE